MNHFRKIQEIYRIPFLWCLGILAFYSLKLLGISYAKGETKLRFYIHLMKCNGKITSIKGDRFVCKYRFLNKDLTVILRNFPSSDPNVFEQIFVDQEYRRIVDLLQTKTTPLTMIDAGANIGLTSIYFNFFFNNINIVAIEPDKENFELLVQNFKFNELSVEGCINSALWSTNEFLKTSSRFRDGKSWSVKVEEAQMSNFDVIGVTLEELFSRFNFETLDLLKMDIEGSEKKIFQDRIAIEKIIMRIKYFAIEIHDEVSDRQEIEMILTNTGSNVFHYGELTIGSNERM